MAEKINRNFLAIFWLLIIGLLVYSRFVNLGWGLPYPMHPDERNMAAAIQQLRWEDKFNPHFFAYGQFPLYLAYFLIGLTRGFKDFTAMKINLQEAIITLRFISALASVINALVIFKIVKLIIPKLKTQTPFIWLMIIFPPYAIQLAHFGTTESLLMLFYSLIIYLCFLYLDKKIKTKYFVLFTSFTVGAALATKVSSLIFILLPTITLMFTLSWTKGLLALIGLASGTGFFTILFSPHNFISASEFLGSMRYEGDVALGSYIAFYTRQFVDTLPVWFQLTKVFPYVLGMGMSLISLIGLMGIGWRNKKINLLRLAFLIYFVSNTFFFAKWTRFMAPVFPLMSIFAILLILNIKNQISKISSKLKVFRFALGFALCTLIFALIIPGISYLSIYQKPDVRFQASEWIYNNIPQGSYILSETANVVDIPFEIPGENINKNYSVISFNFYDLDGNRQLQEELKQHLKKADYIFVPSRRIFANVKKKDSPVLEKYYQDLFSGKLGFKKVAEFSSGLNDESAEETWTVFDHPVIRIYKRY